MGETTKSDWKCSLEGSAQRNLFLGVQICLKSSSDCLNAVNQMGFSKKKAADGSKWALSSLSGSSLVLERPGRVNKMTIMSKTTTTQTLCRSRCPDSLLLSEEKVVWITGIGIRSHFWNFPPAALSLPSHEGGTTGAGDQITLWKSWQPLQITCLLYITMLVRVPSNIFQSLKIMLLCNYVLT